MAHRDDFTERVGARIRELRKQAGMTQRDLAGDDMSPGFLSQVERGLTSPSLHSLHIIAENLGVPTSALMPGTASESDDRRSRIEILLSLTESQRLIGQLEEALASAERARREMQEGAVCCDELRASASLQSGLAHLEREAHDLAFSDLTAAAELFEGAPDPAGALQCLLGLGDMHLQRENPLLAVQFFETVMHRADELVQGQQDTYRLLAEWGLGRAYQALTETETANEILGEALRRAGLATDITSEVMGAIEAAQQKLDEGDCHQARLHSSRARTLAGLNFIQRAEAGILHTSALVWEDAGERSRALSALAEAARIASELAESTLLARILLARGMILLRSDNLPEASATTAESLDLIDPTSEPILRGQAALLGGKVAFAREQHATAESLLTEAETCFRGAADLSRLAQTQAELGRVYLATGHRDEALHRFRRASDLFSRISPGSGSFRPPRYR